MAIIVGGMSQRNVFYKFFVVLKFRYRSITERSVDYKCRCPRHDLSANVHMPTTVSSRFEERKISEPGWDVLNFRLRSYLTCSGQIGP